ncbi:MAG: hypothetical protein AMS18_10285 [Gemmatimonas sp. SG8_17]|nr:MAG: hypothetical protein AMS18_10285 [Gemmatimonas sp. SG8_17]
MNHDAVEVRLMKRVQNGSYYFSVLVPSKVKPRLFKQGIVEFERRDQAQVVGALAGALAEELCDQYNDKLDPSSCAHSAMDAYVELMAENPSIMFGDELPRATDKFIDAATGVARNR